MTFINPLALLGLVAAAIPALLHLLQRRVPPELEFPAVRYLSAAERESARRLKLRHLLLLILRTALIIVIVLAAARPLVRMGGAGGGAHEPTAVVVILDNSPSSGVVVDGRLVLDRLRVIARTTISRTTSADRVWLMLCDGVLRRGTREALLASVDSATTGWQRLDLVQAVDRAARLVDAQPLPGREVHVLSDLQRSALAEGRAVVPAGVRVLSLAALDRAVANRGIAEVRVTEGAAVIELKGAGAGSASGDAAQPVPVTIRVGAGRRDRGEISARGLATPGSAVTIEIPVQNLSPGWWVGEALLEPDELRADDRRPFAWRVAPAARVTATAGAGGFVAAALAVLREGSRVRDGSDVTFTGGEALAGELSIVQPPADPALVGQANRALGARGVSWQWGGGATSTPGPISAPTLNGIAGVQVIRRYRLEQTSPGSGGSGGGSSDQSADDVLATVNDEPWLVRAGSTVLLGSRMDTAWTVLPATPAFVPFIDALANRIVRGEADVTTAEGAPRVEFRRRGTDTTGATVFGPDPRESDLTPAPKSLVETALGGEDRVEVLGDAEFASERFSGTRRTDGSGFLLVLALLLAASELGVATRTR
ncbi:MAG TPA: BatA domain-containing protein [Gemmatimonadales bacterium]|nr:BatA domain-containing protein [Gemmatimonadales bacterium]